VRNTIYFHGDCLDGFGAAWAAWRKFGDAARYIPMHYGFAWQPDDVRGRDVFVLDFSFPPEELAAMAKLANSVTQLDHHVSARDAWEKSPVHADRLTVRFDMDKSGARLAWEHFHPYAPLPRGIAHIEDQDLWRFRIEGTRAFCRALRLRPFEFGAWDGVVAAGEDDCRALYAEGEAIERFLAVEVERLARSALVTEVRLEGEAGPVAGLAVNTAALFASELGHVLAVKSGSYGLVWQLAADGEVKASLRAAGAVDVAALAARYGGGGHRNAAGFRMAWGRFAREVLRLPDRSPSSGDPAAAP